ncbi:MAG: hypothetical protein ACQEQC_06600 [Elusimicrobiota bacterium]
MSEKIANLFLAAGVSFCLIFSVYTGVNQQDKSTAGTEDFKKLIKLEEPGTEKPVPGTVKPRGTRDFNEKTIKKYLNQGKISSKEALYYKNIGKLDD